MSCVCVCVECSIHLHWHLKDNGRNVVDVVVEVCGSIKQGNYNTATLRCQTKNMAQLLHHLDVVRPSLCYIISIGSMLRVRSSFAKASTLLTPCDLRETSLHFVRARARASKSLVAPAAISRRWPDGLGHWRAAPRVCGVHVCKCARVHVCRGRRRVRRYVVKNNVYSSQTTDVRSYAALLLLQREAAT